MGTISPTVPPLAIVDTEVPVDALPALRSFGGEHRIERRIAATPDRVATAWLGNEIMMAQRPGSLIGAEAARYPANGTVPRLSEQYHPATLHWQLPGGQVGWMRLRHLGLVEARAEKGRLTVAGRRVESVEARYGPDHRTYLFQFHMPGQADRARFRANRWALPGLSIRIESPLAEPEVICQGEEARVIYTLPETEREALFQFEIQF